MELWEVFKELEAKPDRTFRTTYDGRTFEIKNVDGWFQFNLIDAHGDKRDHLTPSGAFNNNVKADMDWQLVYQPVTWQEAIQEWSEGTKVVWEDDTNRRVFDRGNRRLSAKHQSHMIDQDGDAVTVRMIFGGKWYVED